MVVGSGGREHVVVTGLAKSPQAETIFCVPGNPGITSVRLHAGTTGTMEAPNRIATNKGRVVGVTATLPTIKQARDRAYEAVEKIRFVGMHYRNDIALNEFRPTL